MTKRKATKKELETMFVQIEQGEDISAFNARKALYIKLPEHIIQEIGNWIHSELENK